MFISRFACSDSKDSAENIYIVGPTLPNISSLKERDDLTLYKNTVQQIIQTSMKSASKTNKAGALVYNEDQPSPSRMTVNIGVTNTDQIIEAILLEIAVAKYVNQKDVFFDRALPFVQNEVESGNPNSARFVYITLAGNPPPGLNNDILKLKQKKAIVFVTSVGTEMSKQALEKTLSNADFVFAVNQPEDLEEVKNSITDVKAKGTSN